MRADDGSWTGYMGVIVSAQPRIPKGAILLSEDALALARVWKTRDDDYFSGVELAKATPIEVLRVDQTKPWGSDIYVRVLAGPHKGLEGWSLSSAYEVGDHHRASMIDTIGTPPSQ